MLNCLPIYYWPSGIAGWPFRAIGNPLSDGTWTCTWQNGRQLQKMQKSGETVEFVYNENGLRVQKTATSTGVTKYTLHGKNVVHMTQGSNELHFFYDAQNKPAVVVYNGTSYSYVKDLQGDIVAILDSNKNVVVCYVYDAWGRLISCSGTMANTLGKINPFRYRGYVYDEETEFYYLRSRYYSQHTGRFVNADTGMTQSFYFRDNLFNYVNSNPVNSTDKNGCGDNPLPWRSKIPFDYQNGLAGKNKYLYERWYNRYGWPVHERHWTDHSTPNKHSNPHDHHYNPSDPSVSPTNEDRNLINYPDGNVPDKWDGEDEWNEEKRNYEEEASESEQPQESHYAEAILGSAVIVGGAYLAYQGIKWLIAWGAAVPTGGSSLFLLAIP